MTCRIRRRICLVPLALALACSPAQQAVEQKDAAQITANVAACIARAATQQGATAESVATTCALSEIPDALRLLVDVYQARAKSPIQGDAGP